MAERTQGDAVRDIVQAVEVDKTRRFRLVKLAILLGDDMADIYGRRPAMPAGISIKTLDSVACSREESAAGATTGSSR